MNETDPAHRVGPLDGLRVVEIAGEYSAMTGKLLADLGADVIVVEPPDGSPRRRVGPFADDRPDENSSLFWWHYNTSKRGIVLDLDLPAGAADFRRLVASTDLVVESEDPSRLAALGLDHVDLRADQPRLIWVSITPFGRGGDPGRLPVSDLTLLAEAGPVWNCGYDDHSIPPVRGGGYQSLNVAGLFAAMSALTAVLRRTVSGAGQHIDVSVNAALNVTTESGSFQYLIDGSAVQRQTGRHAASVPTMAVQVRAADGRYVTTGFLPSSRADFQMLLDWLDELGLSAEFAERFFLELGVERGGADRQLMLVDPEVAAMLSAAREALELIAGRLPAYDFFLGSQVRGFQCGIIYAPDEAYEDPHFRARGFQVALRHDDRAAEVRYPGAPYVFSETPWRLARSAPRLGEHTEAVLLASENGEGA